MPDKNQGQIVDIPAARTKTRISFQGSTELFLEHAGDLKGEQVRFLVVGRYVEEGDRETARAGDLHFAKVKIQLLEPVSSDGKGPVKIDERWLSGALEDDPEED